MERQDSDAGDTCPYYRSIPCYELKSPPRCLSNQHRTCSMYMRLKGLDEVISRMSYSGESNGSR